MQNKKQSRIVAVCNSLFKVRLWIDYDRLKGFTFYLIAFVTNLFVPKQAKVVDKPASYQEAVTAMHLSEEALGERCRGLYRLSLIMTLFASSVAAYAMFHLFMAHYQAGIISLIIAMVGFVLAFRYHFWYYQMQVQKLGCTFQEWFWQGLLGKHCDKITH